MKTEMNKNARSGTVTQKKPFTRYSKGFVQTANLVRPQVRKASEERGFVESRLLTHWAEIVGEDTAAMARPVKVGYGRQGMGATLTLLTTGAQAAMLEMQKPKIKEKVNAVYGYAAISRVSITQTAPQGFSDGEVDFTHAKPKEKPPIDKETIAAAKSVAAPVASNELRAALQALGENVMTQLKQNGSIKNGS